MSGKIESLRAALADVEAAPSPLTALHAAEQAREEQIAALAAELAAAEAHEAREVTLAELRSLAEAAAEQEALKAASARKARAALVAYVELAMSAVDEQAALRRQFLAVAGDDVVELAAELEARGVDLSGITPQWWGTSRSPIDQQGALSADVSSFDHALASVLSAAAAERREQEERAAREARRRVRP